MKIEMFCQICLLNLMIWFHFNILLITLPNFWVCAWWKVPAKHFKNCHIYFMHMKNQSCIFHFVLYLISPRYMPWSMSIVNIDQGIQNKVGWNEKREKQLWVFIYIYQIYITYGKFWSVSFELFVTKHKLRNGEECVVKLPK